MRLDWKEILFWIFLVIGVGMVLWRIFGNSPTELEIIVPFMVMMFMKIWSVNDKQIKFEMKVENSFDRMKNDLGLIKEKLKV